MTPHESDRLTLATLWLIHVRRSYKKTAREKVVGSADTSDEVQLERCLGRSTANTCEGEARLGRHRERARCPQSGRLAGVADSDPHPDRVVARRVVSGADRHRGGQDGAFRPQDKAFVSGLLRIGELDPALLIDRIRIVERVDGGDAREGRGVVPWNITNRPARSGWTA